MKFTDKDILDLNEENVKRVLMLCKATPDTVQDNIMLGNFLAKDAPVQVPDVKFNRETIYSMRPAISYLVGQLAGVNTKKINITLQDGFKKYDGTNWTSNKSILFALYYLGCSSSVLPFFIHSRITKNIECPLIKKPDLKPTLSPKDPNFEKWCKENNIIE